MSAFDVSACTALMRPITAIVEQAAAAILDLAARPDVRRKADGSPVTAADEAAEAIICQGLARLMPGVPIVSEEQAVTAPPATAHEDYVLVDPLDGTREFIAGRPEYTINIALMAGGTPRLGIVAAPAQQLVWRGIVGHGAERTSLSGSAAPVPIRVRPRPARGLVIAASRSHLDPRTRAYIDGLAEHALVQVGSAIKFCRIAEGAADLYPRLAPTHDWDVAAGHALLVAAGGAVSTPDGSALIYGTAARLIPGFIATGGATA